MKYVLFFALLFALANAAEREPSPQEIIQRSVVANESDWKEAPRYSFVNREVDTKHDDGKVIKTSEVLMIDGSPYYRLIAVNDRPLSKEQQAREQEKLQQEITRRQQESRRERNHRIARYMKERNQDHIMMKEMANAFNYDLEGEQRLDGHEVWVLKATPKPGYLPVNHEAKVLTGMRGKLWIDKASYHWVKVEAEVVKPVSFFGFLAKVGPGTKFELEQEPVGENLWLPKHFAMKVNATALGFLNEDSSEDDSYRNYRLQPQVVANLQSPE